MTSHSRLLTPLAVLVALCLAAGPAAAQKASPKIGVLETEKVLSGSAAGRKVYSELKTLQDGEVKRLKPMVAEVEAIADKATKQYKEKEAMVRQALADSDKMIKKKRDEALASLDAKLMPVINAYAKKEGYTLVFRKFESGLLYVDDAIDITNAIITALDATK